MKLNKILLAFTYIASIFLLIFLSSATLSYLNDNKDIKGNNLNPNVRVKFEDTSIISIVNFNNNEIIKKFYVKNKNINIEYYDILLDNVVNNINIDDIAYYTLISEGGAYVNETILPNEDKLIASNIKLLPLDKHEYTLKIVFKNNDLNNKTFSANIKITPADNIINYSKRSIGMKITSDVIGSYKQGEELKDGVYYTNNSINGRTVYFYHGSNNLNNNAIFGGKCYKIVRITEDGGIRLIYNGEADHYKCDGTNNIIDTSEYNLRSDFNAYHGYMYGSASSNNYIAEHNNINSSNVKIILDNWYEDNISLFNKFIQNNTIYCNNRNLSKFKLNGSLYDKIGYSKFNSGYEIMNNYINGNINLDCININDRFSLDSEYGNDVLNNSVGLISAEEALLSGINNNSFLSSNVPYWTMTSAYFDGSNAYNFIVDKNKLSQSKVSNKMGIRPVITLKESTLYISGDGSSEYPYLLFGRIL